MFTDTHTMMVRLNNQNLLNNNGWFSGTIIYPITILLGYFVYKYGFCKRHKGRSIKFITPPIPKQIDSKWTGESPIKQQQDHDFIEARCPATGRYLDNFKSMNNKDIDNLIEKAEFAQVKFNELDETTLWEKKLTILTSVRDFILRHQDLITRIACRDSGKTMIDASMGEILVTLEKLNWCIEHGPNVLSPSKRSGPTNLFMKWYKGAEIRYEPLGVISSIVSWNYPFHNLMGPIIASIITGNSIVVKCSEQVVWSSNYFITLVRNCLIACQVDPNLVQLFYCLPPTSHNYDDPLMLEPANYFTSHPGIKHITFIGSQSIAHQILKCASKSLTPVVVELGGKDAFIVLDSYKDHATIASIILRGTFQSTGQNCIGIERVIVSSKNYESLVKLIHERLSTHPLKLGSDIDDEEEETVNVDMGAMISNNRFDQLESMVEDAISKGARLLVGGFRYHHQKYPTGNYFQPTLLVDVTPDMVIAQNEVFGPILVMMRAESTEDCINLANSAPFGLGGSVFGKDLKECNYVANKLKTGNVAINDFATFYVCQLPFGGFNGSGYGKFGGEEGLLGLCNAKSVCYDKLPFVSTQIPRPLDYPLNNEKAWRFVTSFITASYTKSWIERIKSIWTLSKENK